MVLQVRLRLRTPGWGFGVEIEGFKGGRVVLVASVVSRNVVGTEHFVGLNSGVKEIDALAKVFLLG